MLRFLIVSVISRIPVPPVENVAFSMSSASMFEPSPAGKLSGASFVKSSICGPGQGLPGGGGGGGGGVEDDVGDAAFAGRDPGEDGGVDACRVRDRGRRDRWNPAGPVRVALVEDVLAVREDRVDSARGVDRGYREDPVVAR